MRQFLAAMGPIAYVVVVATTRAVAHSSVSELGTHRWRDIFFFW